MGNVGLFFCQLEVSSNSGADLVRQHGFEAAAEVAERVAALVDLHALAVVLDLGVHPVRTLFHGLIDGFARLGLQSEKKSSTGKPIGLDVQWSPAISHFTLCGFWFCSFFKPLCVLQPDWL